MTVAVGFLAGAALNSPRTDFSGTWKLNPALSSFGPLPPLRSLVDRVEQTGAALTIHQSEAMDGRRRTNDAVYKIDGQAVVAAHTAGESRTLARWDGRSLIIESSLEFYGFPMHVRNRWTISRDGRLEILRHFESRQGKIDQKLILERQPAK